MLKNISGQEIYRKETMDEDEFYDSILFNLQCDVYPRLDDSLIIDLIYDLMENMSREAELKFQERIWDEFRGRRNFERRKQRELKKQQQLEKEAI